MSDSHFHRGPGGLLALLAVGPQLCCSPECGRPLRSIVVITIDTLRADHLGCYGYYRETSPFIDRLAHEAVLFENVVTPIATTLPAHVSLWTSLHPLETGIFAK